MSEPVLAEPLQALLNEFDRLADEVHRDPSRSDAARARLATMTVTDNRGDVWTLNEDAIWFRAHPGGQYEPADPTEFAQPRVSGAAPSPLPPSWSASGPATPPPFAPPVASPTDFPPPVAHPWESYDSDSTSPAPKKGFSLAGLRKTKTTTTAQRRTSSPRTPLKVSPRIIAVVVLLLLIVVVVGHYETQKKTTTTTVPTTAVTPTTSSTPSTTTPPTTSPATTHGPSAVVQRRVLASLFSGSVPTASSVVVHAGSSPYEVTETALFYGLHHLGYSFQALSPVTSSLTETVTVRSMTATYARVTLHWVHSPSSPLGWRLLNWPAA